MQIEVERTPVSEEVREALASRIPQEDDTADFESPPRPLGKCEKCGADLFSIEGFCGGCEPPKV